MCQLATEVPVIFQEVETEFNVWKIGELPYVQHPLEAIQSQLLPHRMGNSCLVSDKHRF